MQLAVIIYLCIGLCSVASACRIMHESLKVRFWDNPFATIAVMLAFFLLWPMPVTMFVIDMVKEMRNS